jgi:tetratricopeptide (TPR) repeat protein
MSENIKAQQVTNTIQNTDADQSTASASEVRSLVISYCNAVEGLSTLESDTCKQKVLSVLMARDVLADALTKNRLIPKELAFNLAELDRKLQEQASLILSCVNSLTLGQWRETFQPPQEAWWWALDQRVNEFEQRHSVKWTILTVFAFTLTLSIAADITSRFFSGIPDKLSIISTSSQVFLALLAGSTFTTAGRNWLGKLLSSFHIKKGLQPFASFLFALVILFAAIGFRYSLPAIARYYNREGGKSLEQNKMAEALSSFQRAVSLDPENYEAQYNLAHSYERVFDYDKAITGYQKTVELKPDFNDAYNNLAHSYIMYRSDYKRALDVLSNLLASPIKNDETKYAAYKNRGWAFLGLQQFKLAEKDFRLAIEVQDFAEAHCMLGEALSNLGEKDDAVIEWGKCLEMSKRGDSKGVEPYWQAIAMTGIQK